MFHHANCEIEARMLIREACRNDERGLLKGVNVPYAEVAEMKPPEVEQFKRLVRLYEGKSEEEALEGLQLFARGSMKLNEVQKQAPKKQTIEKIVKKKPQKKQVPKRTEKVKAPKKSKIVVDGYKFYPPITIKEDHGLTMDGNVIKLFGQQIIRIEYETLKRKGIHAVRYKWKLGGRVNTLVDEVHFDVKLVPGSAAFKAEVLAATRQLILCNLSPEDAYVPHPGDTQDDL